MVDRGQRHALGHPGQAHPQRCRARPVHGDSPPGERQQRPAVRVQQATGRDRVQCGVQQRGVQPEAVRAGAFRQRHLGDHVLARAQHRAQPLEHRPVLQSGLGQRRVEVGGVHGARAGRGPGDGVRRGPRRTEQAVGVAGPVHGADRAGVHADRPPALGVGRADRHLHLNPVLVGQAHRGVDGQLLDPRATDLRADPRHRLHERRARQQHGAPHGVIGQPRVRPAGQGAGQQRAVAVGQRDHRAQRVPGLVGDRGALTGFQPEPLALEGVGGQRHRSAR